MKKVFIAIVLFVSYSCSTSKGTSTKLPIYEIISVENNGGASIKFYETLSEQNEIIMLLNDKKLKKKVKPTDYLKSSFLILNAGPTSEDINKVTIEKVEEKQSQIEVYIKDLQENISIDSVDENTFYPITIIKINSKKPIVIK